MTEENPVLPGWAEARLDEILAGVPSPSAGRVRYLECLARARLAEEREPAFEGCHAAFLDALAATGLDPTQRARLGERLEALEEEIIEGS